VDVYGVADIDSPRKYHPYPSVSIFNPAPRAHKKIVQRMAEDVDFATFDSVASVSAIRFEQIFAKTTMR
jgi:hypothetical protein